VVFHFFLWWWCGLPSLLSFLVVGVWVFFSFVSFLVVFFCGFFFFGMTRFPFRFANHSDVLAVDVYFFFFGSFVFPREVPFSELSFGSELTPRCSAPDGVGDGSL